MAEWCTKQSFWPFSGVMKPKPLASLNHLTVPVIRIADTPEIDVSEYRACRTHRTRLESCGIRLTISSSSRPLPPRRAIDLKHKGATARATPLWSTELCASCALLPHGKASL